MPSLDAARRAWMARAAMAAAAWLLRPDCTSAEPASLAALAHELLQRRPAPALQRYLDEWPHSVTRRPVIPSPLPVLRYLPALSAGAPHFSAALAAALSAEASRLAWRRSYSQPDVSAQFLENYGWTEFIGLTGPAASERIACGALLLGPDTVYPPHHHEAQEIYLPLSGVAAWKQGGGEWRERAPGTVIHHRPNESHAMQTGASPLLALYLWRSSNLAQKSQLD